MLIPFGRQVEHSQNLLTQFRYDRKKYAERNTETKFSQANSDTQQTIIWAFGTTPPSSSAVDATFQQHLDSGTLTLDLTNSISSTESSSPASSSQSPSSSGSTDIPLTANDKLIVAHGILATIGFLLLLPAGTLIARYLRTFTAIWFTGHWITQLLICTHSDTSPMT